MVLFLNRKGAKKRPITNTRNLSKTASGIRGNGRPSRLVKRHVSASTHLAKASFAGRPA
jgi:hypothetical protein